MTPENRNLGAPHHERVTGQWETSCKAETSGENRVERTLSGDQRSCSMLGKTWEVSVTLQQTVVPGWILINTAVTKTRAPIS